MTVDRSKVVAAWSLWTLFAGVTIGLLLFLALNDFASDVSTVAQIGLVLATGAFATVGALVASRRPDNPIGWLFLAIGLTANAGRLAQHYARYALITSPGSIGGGVTAAWVGSWLFGLGIELIMFLLLLFPTGRPTSHHWRPVGWLVAAGIAALALAIALFPGPIDSEVVVQNPFGIAGTEGFFGAMHVAANIVLPVVVVASVASLIVRARRSAGDERQQLKWFGYAAAFMFVAAFLVNPAVERLWPRSGVHLQDVPFAVGISLVPIATGTAILKYRLYEIDRIINRTLVYSSLTAFLALTYVLGVVLIQRLLAPFIEGSQISVASSTLLVAGLFRPVRSRIQHFIDRRFYRHKYDAAQTLESFSARLRQEVDLGQLSSDLVAVVKGTLRPAHVTLWVRPLNASSRKDAHSVPMGKKL